MSVLSLKDAISKHKPIYMYRVHIWPLPQRSYYTDDEIKSFLTDCIPLNLKLAAWDDSGVPLYEDITGHVVIVDYPDKSFSSLTIYINDPILRDGVKFYVSTRKSTPEALLTKIEMIEGIKDKNHEWLYHFRKKDA